MDEFPYVFFISFYGDVMTFLLLGEIYPSWSMDLQVDGAVASSFEAIFGAQEAEAVAAVAPKKVDWGAEAGGWEWYMTYDI